MGTPRVERPRPARWIPRGLALAAPLAGAVGIAVYSLFELAPGPAWYGAVLSGCAVLLAELVPVVLASRLMSRPLSAELGNEDVEVKAPIRSSMQWLPGWLARDDVRLTDESLVITVRPGARWAYAQRIALADVRSVSTRPADPQDGPWFVVDGEHLL